MSRVHDALRRAEQLGIIPLPPPAGEIPPAEPRLRVTPRQQAGPYAPADFAPIGFPAEMRGAPLAEDEPSTPQERALVALEDLPAVLSRVEEIPYVPATEAHLIRLDAPAEMPGEEFRSLRTRLNHLQSTQKLRTVVVTSASPAEGKTFTALNLALAQAQLSEHPILMADLDLRRPSIHRLLQIERGLGFSDYIQGEAPLEQCLRRIEGTPLFVMTAGSSVNNPLELLGTGEAKATIEERFPKLFKWSIIDSPPLLFSADANLLATITDGTLIVVRVGSTTYDNIVRAMQTLCENNVLGIVVNGARASELYSKYTYYYSKSD
jgi:capsular exopolysaccharide synthesis family protein